MLHQPEVLFAEFAQLAGGGFGPVHLTLLPQAGGILHLNWHAYCYMQGTCPIAYFRKTLNWHAYCLAAILRGLIFEPQERKNRFLGGGGNLLASFAVENPPLG